MARAGSNGKSSGRSNGKSGGRSGKPTGAKSSGAKGVHKILHEVLSLPTAPFAEHYVLDYIRAFAKRRPTVTLTEDAAGNLLLHLRRGRNSVKRPVCITAHTDHPGFVADAMIGSSKLRAFWRGGVPPEFFRDSKVRFYVDGDWVKGAIESIVTGVKDGKPRVETANVKVADAVPTGSIGMWDFGEPVVRGQKIHARGCDDLAGVAAMLTAVDRLAKARGNCDAYFLFTRAEEVGFVGAIAAARAKTIPLKCFVVAMETSSELPSAQMGDGPILRVGDRASTFTPEVTAHCHRVARELAASDSSFVFQRKLMDGGTCESSAYCTLGYDATGLCIALGNYHNVDRARGKLGMEYVHLADFDNVVKWFVALATSPHRFAGKDETLTKQIKGLEKTWQPLLKKTVAAPA